MEPKPCTFCKPGFFEGKDVIYKTDNFGVVASLNPEYPYQGLIIPRKHIRSYGYIPDEHVTELCDIKEAVGVSIRALTTEGKLFYHEHGDAETPDYEVLGQSVKHAHIGFRVVPRDLKMRRVVTARSDALAREFGGRLRLVTETMPSTLGYFQKDDTHALVTEGISQSHKGYLYFSQGIHEGIIMDSCLYVVDKEIPTGKGGPVHKFFAVLLEEALHREGASNWEALEASMKKPEAERTLEERALIAKRDETTARNVEALSKELKSRLG